MIAPESIQQVIQRSDIVEVVEQFVKLRRRGSNYIGNCPFHNEKTPSFNVNPSKGIFKCFGCGKGGDVVSFIEEYEKFSFVEAIRWLAEYYNIELQETEASDSYKAQQQIEESLRILNDFAADYFHDLLLHSDEGQLIGLSYFQERGFRPHIIEKFKLGYALDQWDAFITTAKTKGFSQEIMEHAGLIKVREQKVYDSYRGRVIFPIFSPTGKVLGFGARILKKTDNAPKYVNSPENELYVKNKVLYGLYQSRQSISKENECFLVEGYTDVISLHQAGVSNVVASSGTSLTEGQLKLIGNLSKNLTILYDGDSAGIKAALRGLDMALGGGFNVKLVLLPDGEDPDSFVQKNGAERFQQYVNENKRDVIGFRLEVGMKEVGNDPIKKSQLVNEIAETISKINKAEDFTLQQHYIHESALQLRIEEEGLVTLVNKYIRERVQQDQRHRERQETTPKETPVTIATNVDSPMLSSRDYAEEWQLLRILLEYGNKNFRDEGLVAQVFFDTIDLNLLEEPLAKKIASEYAQYWKDNGHIPPLSYFTSHSDRAVRHKTADIVQVGFEPSRHWKEMHKIEVNYGEDIYQEEVESTFAYFELKLLRRLLIENMEQLKTVQDPAQMANLIKAHTKLKEREKELMALVILR